MMSTQELIGKHNETARKSWLKYFNKIAQRICAFHVMFFLKIYFDYFHLMLLLSLSQSYNVHLNTVIV